MAIRNIINNGSGRVKNGWLNFRNQDLNDKERAEHAYKWIMGEQQHFLAHKRLMEEYWLGDGLLITDVRH
jgi:hypothetical protein